MSARAVAPGSLRTVAATRYVTPLREGGSLPAIIEADDDGLYVLKFRGAGQGAKALIAELVAGELARGLGLPVPEIVLVELDPDLARTEPDPEIQDLIRASPGLNLALDYLPGSVMFDPVAETVASELASSIVWFDGYMANIDRTPRNTNLLLWHRRLWLIDHGAAIYFHHAWETFAERSRDPFPMIKNHVLLPFAGSLGATGDAMTARLTTTLLQDVVYSIPLEWLADPVGASSPEEHRKRYIEFLTRRLEPPQTFLDEAIRARSLHL